MKLKCLRIPLTIITNNEKYHRCASKDSGRNAVCLYYHSAFNFVYITYSYDIKYKIKSICNDHHYCFNLNYSSNYFF